MNWIISELVRGDKVCSLVRFWGIGEQSLKGSRCDKGRDWRYSKASDGTAYRDGIPVMERLAPGSLQPLAVPGSPRFPKTLSCREMSSLGMKWEEKKV